MTVGPRDSASVATNIYSLLEMDRLSFRHQYLFLTKPQRPYPLPKFLILLATLSSKTLKPAERKVTISKTKVHISDPWYLHWLKSIFFLKKIKKLLYMYNYSDLRIAPD